MTSLAKARRVVIKVGSALLVDAAKGSADRAWLDAFAAEKGVEILSLPTGQGLLLHP